MSVEPDRDLSVRACARALPAHRGLQASVGHVAAHRHILAVFAGVQRHLSVAALCDGALPACALHAVHVDGAGTCRGGGHIRAAFPVQTLKLYVEMAKLDTNWSMEGKSMFT